MSPRVSFLAFLAALLIVPLFASPGTASAGSSADSPRTILRLRGGAAFKTDGRDEVGWVAGGAIGYAVHPNVLVSLNLDRVHVNSFGTSVHPALLQFEFGAPLSRRFAPRFEIGAGVYARTVRGLIYQPVPLGGGLTDRLVAGGPSSSSYPFGLMIGGGISAAMTGNARLDLDARYHQNTESVVFDTVSLGITYGLR
jgi:opacity protein-like surface antigen